MKRYQDLRILINQTHLVLIPSDVTQPAKVLRSIYASIRSILPAQSFLRFFMKFMLYELQPSSRALIFPGNQEVRAERLTIPPRVLRAINFGIINILIKVYMVVLTFTILRASKTDCSWRRVALPHWMDKTTKEISSGNSLSSNSLSPLTASSPASVSKLKIITFVLIFGNVLLS